jgi:CheY-like chemotaxis protein
LERNCSAYPAKAGLLKGYSACWGFGRGRNFILPLAGKQKSHFCAANRYFGTRKKHVLVIDDDKSIQRVIRFRLIQHENLKVSEATSGNVGVELARTQTPDLILLDWMLPDINGPDVLARLKRLESTRKIPVLMLTGRNRLGDIEDAFALGADTYMTKPVSLGKLGAKVRELLV